MAEAEVAAPSDDVWLQLFDQLLQTEPPCPACHVSDLPLEFVERLWRDAPLAPVIRDAEPKKLALLRHVNWWGMKTHEEFSVPLSDRTAEIIAEARSRALSD